MRFQKVVKVIANNARLNNGPLFCSVYCQYFAKMFGDVYHNSGPYYLSGKGSPCSTWDYRSVVFTCKANKFNNVFFGSRNSNRYRNFPVSRSICGVKFPGG